MGRREGREESVGRLLVGLVLIVGSLVTAVSPADAATALRAYLVPDVASADPGDLVAYTVALDNAGPMASARVWANLTVPGNARIFDDTAWQLPAYAGSWVSGSRRHYNFTNLPVANNTFTVTITILAGPPDGAPLPSSLAVNYTDDLGVPQAEVGDAAAVVMSIPVLELAKTPTSNPVDPGARFSYTISVRNSGSAASSTVWLNDTLPSQLAFVNVNPPPMRSRCTNEDCRLVDLAPGATATYEIVVDIGPTVPRGTSFVNWLFANFTDADGTLLPSVSTFAGTDVRVIQDLTLDKVARANLAYPGAAVVFSIWFNNTASTALGATWINDTLPPGMTHSASNPPATVSGNMVRWQLSGVAVGANVAELTVTIGGAVANGTVLVNEVRGDYYDGSGNRGQQVVASTSVTVSDTVPKFDGFAKVASEAASVVGASVRFTIFYNNTGFDPAGTVVIEDTIPPGTLLANPSVAPAAIDERTHEWRFADVSPGSHLLTYDLVLADVSVGATLVNFAYLNYTDPFGSPLSSPPPRSAVVRVVVGEAGAPESAMPLLIGVVLALAVVGAVGYRVFLGKRKTVIDEVFLLHRDGLLIKHYTRRVRPDIDSDILSGMLIAVQNFVNESFIGSEGLQKEGQLDELRFGEFRLVIERGQWVVVAAVLSGDPTDRVKGEVKAAILDLERDLGGALDGWSGEMRSVEGADKYMQDLITGKYSRRAWGKG